MSRQLDERRRAERVHYFGPVEHHLCDPVGLAAHVYATARSHSCQASLAARQVPSSAGPTRPSVASSSPTSWNRTACTRCTSGISVSTSWPVSPGDSTISRPQPNIRSSKPCHNHPPLLLFPLKSLPPPHTTPPR